MAHWKFALAQHPMYLIVRECATCAERTPPWGEPTIERYVARLRSNVAALRGHPELRLGYEWSGVELELLAEDAPDVLADLRALAAEGRVAFYNGTYAQPHLQVLSSEANLRQFEHGARTYRELLGCQVRTYAHQEASVHDQVPQLLRAFGIRLAVVPRFASTLRWLEGGELVVLDWQGPRFVEGAEFVRWEGLDGSQVPLYLQLPRGGGLDDWLAAEEMAGQLRVPPVLVKIADLVEVDDAWLERHREVDLVLLDQALEERLRRHPPCGRARFSTNWSYVEGIMAEELCRSTWRAEAAALRAEALGALAFALCGRPAEPVEAAWRSILTAQHHDVHCFCAPELRATAIGWLRAAEASATGVGDRAAEGIAADVDCGGGEGRPVVVFSTVPHAHRALVTLDSGASSVADGAGRDVPAGADGARVRFLAGFDGAGHATFWLRGRAEPAAPALTDEAVAFENACYRAVVRPDGTFASLALQAGGEELLDAGGGNQLAAADSEGVSPRRPDQGEREDWQRPASRPRPLPCERTAPAAVLRTPLGLTLRAALRLGPRVSAAVTVELFHELPRIDVEWVLSFDRASIGTFYDDGSKLCLHWPLGFDGEIAHDIPFGVTGTRAGLPFFPASWVDVSDGARGLAYLHQGTPKHWVSGRTLVNLLAWGEDTEAIGSRMWRHNWPTAFDQRLDGTHTIRCAVLPHAGGWREAGLAAAARAYAAPPQAVPVAPHRGSLPASAGVLALGTSEVAATALLVRGGEVVCRLYGVGSGPAAVRPGSCALEPAGLRALADGPVDRVAPFQVAELALRRTRRG
jgi:alpha-mannosidase